jgi:hypothetical protein
LILDENVFLKERKNCKDKLLSDCNNVLLVLQAIPSGLAMVAVAMAPQMPQKWSAGQKNLHSSQ